MLLVGVLLVLVRLFGRCGFAESILVPVSGLLGADEGVLSLVVLNESTEPLRSTSIEAELIFASLVLEGVGKGSRGCGDGGEGE